MPRRKNYRQVLSEWGGGEPTPQLFEALGRMACGELAGTMVGSMLVPKIGKRVFQLLEIAVEEGLRLSSENPVE